MRLLLAVKIYRLATVAVIVLTLPGLFNSAAAVTLDYTTDLKLWLKADEGVVTNGQPAAGIASPGNVVSWNDSSGNGHTATSVGGAGGPSDAPDLYLTGLNGLPVVHFHDDYMTIDGQVQTSSDFTIFGVMNTSNVNNFAYRTLYSNWDFTNQGESVYFGTVDFASTNQSWPRFTDNLTNPDNNTFTNPDKSSIIRLVHDASGGTSSIYQNGTLVAEGTAAPRNFTSQFVLGRQGANSVEWRQGDLAEFLVYDDVLSATDTETVEDYLHTKWFTNGVDYTAPPAYDGYRTDLGWWFQKDVEDNAGLPTTTTLGASGEWELRFPENTVGTPTTSIPWSGQAGWCQGDGATCSVDQAGNPNGQYGYLADENWSAGPTDNLPLGTDAVTGHGLGQFTWTAPDDFSAGAINVDGYFQQLYSPERLMQLRAVVNGDEGNSQILTTAVAPPDDSTMSSQTVAYSGSIDGLSAGDTIDFYVEPANPDLVGGNGINTFVQTSIVLTQPAAGGGLAGDYNNDGTVDAADYTLYKDAEGTSNTLANDAIGGTIGAAHYQQWASAFGQTAASGSAAVPEPATLLLVVISLAGIAALRCKE